MLLSDTGAAVALGWMTYACENTLTTVAMGFATY